MMKKTQYSPKEEQELMAYLLSPELADDPYKWVMAAFPWGQKGTPLAKFKGPRKWQVAILKRIAKHIFEGKMFDLCELLQLARASGRGIGKSALVAWLMLWFLSTRIGATVIVSANTEDQLRKVTFAEALKWSTMALNSHWFEVVGITVTPAKWLKEIVERDLQKGTGAWGAFGKLWSEDNPDAYAGAHNHEGMMVIYDEASGIPDAIWAVAKGFFTELTPNRFWFAFSQGRRNSGYFFEIFHKKRDMWDWGQIDARTVEGTDPSLYQEIINEYGDESDEARVEVYGLFPANDDEIFISPSLVDKAVARKGLTDTTAPIVIGIDPSGGGSDWFVIYVRQGNATLEIIKFKIEDTDEGTMIGVGHIIQAINKYKPALTVCDRGSMGGPIADRCNEQKYKVRKVDFGWKSSEPHRWGNKRAEMWGKMRKWLQTGSIPDDARLKTDLSAPKKKPDSKGVMFLESKKDMRARGMASPDHADALAVTFAFPVARRDGMVEPSKQPNHDRGYAGAHVATGWMGN